MEQTLSYKPQHVCSSAINITYEDGVVKKIQFVGGCPGNTQGVARLAEGRKIEELIGILDGVVCPRSGAAKTSCPAELAKALKQIQ